MIRELVKDDEILSQRCERAMPEDVELAQDLIDTVATLEDGACLAANQIGVTKAVVVWLDEEQEPHVMYNPKLLFGVGAQRTVEGCLTREEPSNVRRFQKIKVTYDELIDGELKHRKRDFTGWTAQMIQHMIDHCNGKLV